MAEDTIVIIMAGGQGKRFGTNKIKVLQKVNDIPMLVHLIRSAIKINPIKIFVVVGVYKDIIQNTVKEYIDDLSNVEYILQENALGTGHAIQCCERELLKYYNYTKVIILSGDTPLFTSTSMIELSNKLIDGSGAVVLVRKTENSNGYGRIVRSCGNFERIVEEKDASDEEKQIKLINTGIYCIRLTYLLYNLELLNNNNAQKEYYLTDLITLIKNNQKTNIMLYELPQNRSYEVIGVNTPSDLELLLANL